MSKKTQAQIERKKQKEQQAADMEEFLAAQIELNELKKQAGQEPQEKGLKRLISSLFERSEKRPKVTVNRKKLLWLTILTGAFGGHRFYTRQYGLAIAYLLLCPTGVSIAMSIIDVIVFLPMMPDENGNIVI